MNIMPKPEILKYSFKIENKPVNGKCDKCNADTVVFPVSVSFNNKTTKTNLCKKCAVDAKKKVDEKNEESHIEQEFSKALKKDTPKIKHKNNSDISQKAKSFRDIYSGFFTAKYWNYAINNLYSFLFESYIVKKLLLIFPLASAVIFLFAALGFAPVIISFIAAFTLVFYTLTTDYISMSFESVIPGTLLSIATVICGIEEIHYPIILVLGIILLVITVFNWLLIIGVLDKKYNTAFFISSATELAFSFIFIFLGMSIGFRWFMYGLSTVLFLLSQIIQLVLYLPMDKFETRLTDLRNLYAEKCAEKECESVYLDESDDKTSSDEEVNSKTNRMDFFDNGLKKDIYSSKTDVYVFDNTISEVNFDATEPVNNTKTEDISTSTTGDKFDSVEKGNQNNGGFGSLLSGNFDMDFLDGDY